MALIGRDARDHLFSDHFVAGEGDASGDGAEFGRFIAFWTQYFIRSSRLRS
jgi:hypothetical protein